MAGARDVKWTHTLKIECEGSALDPNWTSARLESEGISISGHVALVWQGLGTLPFQSLVQSGLMIIGREPTNLTT
jgi:hypothetical protein